MNSRLAIVGVAGIVVGALAITGSFARTRSIGAVAQPIAPPLAGTRLPAIEWPSGQSSLAIVISSSCDENAPTVAFLRDAAAAAQRSGVYVIAISAAPKEALHECLRRWGLPVADLQRARLEQVAAVTTPTLILVDHAGYVRASWSGELTHENRKKVLRYLNLPAPQRAGR